MTLKILQRIKILLKSMTRNKWIMIKALLLKIQTKMELQMIKLLIQTQRLSIRIILQMKIQLLTRQQMIVKHLSHQILHLDLDHKT